MLVDLLRSLRFSVDLGLLAQVPGAASCQYRLGSVQANSRPVDRFTGPPDDLFARLENTWGSGSEIIGALEEICLSGVEHRLAPVRPLFPLVSQAIARVGGALSLIGRPVPRVSGALSLVGLPVRRVG